MTLQVTQQLQSNRHVCSECPSVRGPCGGPGKEQKGGTLTLHAMSVQDPSPRRPPSNPNILPLYPSPLPQADLPSNKTNAPGCALSPAEFIRCPANHANLNFVLIYLRKGNYNCASRCRVRPLLFVHKQLMSSSVLFTSCVPSCLPEGGVVS